MAGWWSSEQAAGAAATLPEAFRLAEYISGERLAGLVRGPLNAPQT